MAPARVNMEGEVEIKFAQKLAGNEKEGRDKALRKLKKWIKLKSSPTSESAFTELELLKLWKGLFFCMWMSDKPLVQEQLAEELSQLVHLFPHRPDGVAFCRAFFTTMAREWHSIDVIRREKFMMLVRRVLRQALSLLLPSDSCGGSSDGGDLAELTALCEAAFARREEPARLPLGLQLHLVEIFLEELAKVGGHLLTTDQLAELLQPFIQVLTESRQSALRRTVTDGVFHQLMRQSDVGIAHEALLNGEELAGHSGEEECPEAGSDSDQEPVLDPRAGGVDVTLPRLTADYARLAEDLTTAGADPSVRQQNRAALYRLAQQFRDLSEGEYPLAVKLPEVVDSDSDISDQDMEAAVLRLQSTKQHLNRDSRRNQKAGKRLRPDTEEEPQPKKKQKKLKPKLPANGAIDTGEEMLADLQKATPPAGEDAASGEAGEAPSGEGGEPPGQRRRTLKERRKQKLRERREAEQARQERRRRKLEAKRAKLNGEGEQGGPVNGVVNGEHESGGDETAREASEASEQEDRRVNGPSEEATETPAEVTSSATPVIASKKKKKKRPAEGESPKANDAASLDDSASPKTKKKKPTKKSTESVDTETHAPTEAPLEAPSPPAASTQENGVFSPPQQKKKAKKKKHQPQPSAPAASAQTADSQPAAKAAARPAFDWSLGTEDAWEDPAPVQRPAVTPPPAGRPPVAQFVPSRPVPAFVKLRAGKKAGSKQVESPATPRTPGGTKKVVINLAENRAQGFKEHLITVRNSPQVPHNPHRRPVKGLLKTPPATATGRATATVRATTGRRGQAADFFSV